MANLDVLIDPDDETCVNIWVIAESVEGEDGPEDDICVVQSKKTKQFALAMEKDIAIELLQKLQEVLGES